MRRIADLREKLHDGTLTYKGITWYKDPQVFVFFSDERNGFSGEVGLEDNGDYVAMVMTEEENDKFEDLGPNDNLPVPPERTRVFNDFDSAIDWATNMLNGNVGWQEPLF